jgi:hypothetical protein
VRSGGTKLFALSSGSDYSITSKGAVGVYRSGFRVWELLAL